MRILVIEDDPHVAAALRRRLTRDGFNVDWTDLGEDGIGLVRHYAFDLVLLDLNLPDMSGQSVLRRLKLVGRRVPVMVLSGDDSAETRIRCLDAGADDYLCKPCHGDELVARVRAIIRRTNGHISPLLEFGDLCVDMQERAVRIGTHPVPLTRREYQLLELLALRRGATVTKNALLTHMYGGQDEPDAKIIDVYVCKIRHKLQAIEPELEARIETVWGRGYALRLMPLARPCPIVELGRHRPSQVA